MCGTESDYRYRGATQATAEDGGLLAKLTFPQYSGSGLKHRAAGTAVRFRKRRSNSK